MIDVYVRDVRNTEGIFLGQFRPRDIPDLITLFKETSIILYDDVVEGFYVNHTLTEHCDKVILEIQVDQFE